jgi:hypothetical protein
MSDADEKTPVDNRTTIELFADDMKATKLAAQNTETVQLQMYEELKATRRALLEMHEDFCALQAKFLAERQRSWFPALVSVAAAMLSAAFAFAASR